MIVSRETFMMLFYKKKNSGQGNLPYTTVNGLLQCIDVQTVACVDLWKNLKHEWNKRKVASRICFDKVFNSHYNSSKTF